MAAGSIKKGPTPTERQQQVRAWMRRAEAGQPCRIKTCGMFRPEDIDAVNDARPDLVGFIVDFPHSHRTLTPARFARLAGSVACGPMDEEGACVRVGVFVDEPLDELEFIVTSSARHAIDAVQLHGRENDAYVDQLHADTGIGIIQAFQLHGEQDVLHARVSHADMVLLDSGQGTGKPFDWKLLAGFDRPFLLAGGLGPDNVAEAVEHVHPWGVDMSSSLETGRNKDPEKIAAAVQAVRKLGTGVAGN
jgi:phosphoribosylanthranilate isomerase